MDQRGFSLAEIGMATAILITVGSAVAATGSVMMEQTKERELIERLKDLYQAGEKSLAMVAERGETQRFPGWVDSSPYMAFRPTGGTWDWYIKNPYTLTDDFIIVDWCNTNSGYCDSYPNTAYGSGLVPIKGRVIFFVAADPVKAFRVWNGVTDVYFRSYAFQAIDKKGYPLVTMGR